MKLQSPVISKLSVILLVVTLTTATSGQNRAAPTLQEWGIGVISLPGGKFQSEAFTFTDDTVSVYSSPNGPRIGILYRRVPAYSYFHDRIVIFEFDSAGENPRREVLREDQFVVSYEGSALKYYDSSDNFVEVLRHTLRGKVRGWLQVDEIRGASLDIMQWRTYLLDHQSSEFFKEIPQSLHIRTGPDTNSEIVGTITDGEPRIVLTGEFDGKWFQVKVADQNIFMKQNLDDVNWTYGWIKALSDRGQPNIWFPVYGC